MDRVDYQPLIIQDLLSWNKNGELELSPWYQRRSVWNKQQKSFLINTILERKPIPTLYFRHEVDLEADKTVREVVDGQQRIRALIEFVDGEYTTRHPESGKRVYYDSLSSTEKKRFRETSLSGGWLLGATEQDVIEIFGRLNAVAKTLNAAEKRNATYGGEFKQFCLRQAASRVSVWRDLSIFTATQIARMQEVQFLADVTLNYLRGLSDYSSPKLDNIYKEFDEEFPEEKTISKRLERSFSKIVELPASTFTDTIFSRQPLFFSLLVVLDSLEKLPSTKTLQRGLEEIDARYETDQKSKKDMEFFNACRASTQRLANRRIRDRYILETIA